MKLTPTSFSKPNTTKAGHTPCFFVSFVKIEHTMVNDEQYDEEKSFRAVDADLFF